MLAEGGGHVLGCRDEPAEDDGMVAVVDEVLDEGDGVGQFGVLLTLQALCQPRHVEQPPPSLGRIATVDRLLSSRLVADGWVCARDDVDSFEGVIAAGVEDVAPPQLVGLFRGGGGRRSARARSVAAAAAGLEASDRRRASADHHRTRWRWWPPELSMTVSRA